MTEKFNALAFVRDAHSIKAVVAKINECQQREDLAAAYAINSLQQKKSSF